MIARCLDEHKSVMRMPCEALLQMEESFARSI
jgi:hypothetical protein